MPILTACSLVTAVLSQLYLRTFLFQTFGSAFLVLCVGRFICKPRSKSPLLNRIEEFRSKLQQVNPRAQHCERGPHRAITAGQLLDFHDYFHAFIRDRTMYYVNANIISPVTQQSALSYAELAGCTTLRWYVSHYWGTPVRHFCESICAHAKSIAGDKTINDAPMHHVHSIGSRSEAWCNIPYWICSFSNNQWHVSDELSETWQSSSFYLAMRSGFCQGTCMVLDPAALPLTRSWCLFELLQTLQMERQQSPFFKGLVFCTSAGVLNDGVASTDIVMGVAERIAALDLADAGATCRRDREMIRELVQAQPGGFPAVTGFVRRYVREVLLLAKQRVNTNFDRIFESLQVEMEEAWQRIESLNDIDKEIENESLATVEYPEADESSLSIAVQRVQRATTREL